MTINWTIRTVIVALLIVIAVFAVLGTSSVAVWEYTNSDAFCSNACHQVHPENPDAHHASQHARVACVECHIGRTSTFEQVIAKSGHMSHLWSMFLGYERPLTSYSLPTSRQSCEGCHTSNPHVHNSLSARRHFAPDEKNTETKVTLLVRTLGREFQSDSEGIDWHTGSDVSFIATDPQRQNIPWIEVTHDDGTKVVYSDVISPLDETAIASAETTEMHCIDCHNRVGHPFRNPETVVDEALADGTLTVEFPYAKARLSKLLSQEFETREEALELVQEAWTQYAEEFPDLAEQYPEQWENSRKFLEERQNFVANTMVTTRLLHPELDWRSFPDNSGHMNSPGCFRCHSGHHEDNEGNIVPVACTLCHGIPVITQRDRIRGELLGLVDKRRPRSHLRDDFTFTHKDRASEKACSSCHGEIEYGTDDKTFCANSGCHDNSWPNLELARR